MEKKWWRTAFRYTFEFMAAGFVGWLYEVATVWLLFRYFDNRGMLHMPIVPIYAVGAFILLAVMGRKKRSIPFIFLVSFAVTTVFELGASYLLQFIFHQQFWTYETWPLSILDRSCVISSAIFGIMAVAYFYGLHPLSGKLSNKLPEAVCASFTIISASAVIADFVLSVGGLLNNK